MGRNYSYRKLKFLFLLVLDFYYFVKFYFFVNHFNEINTIKITYGNVVDFTSKNKRVISGGYVKLLYLNDLFPYNKKDYYNIHYMVSSTCKRHTRGYALVAKRKGIRLVWNQNGVAYPYWANNNTKMINEYFSSLQKLSDYIIYQSLFCKRSSEKWVGKIDRKSSIIPNCADGNIFNYKKRVKSTNPTLLIVGTQQSIHTILNPIIALRSLNNQGYDFNLKIVGNLNWKDSNGDLQEIVQRNNLNDKVTYIRDFLREDAPHIYNFGDILIHIKYNDASPSTPIEAMASGLPVICSTSGGTEELIDSTCGEKLLVPRDDFYKIHIPTPKDIEYAIIKIFDDLSNYSEAARIHFETNFSKNNWIKKHVIIFNELLQST